MKFSDILAEYRQHGNKELLKEQIANKYTDITGNKVQLLMDKIIGNSLLYITADNQNSYLNKWGIEPFNSEVNNSSLNTQLSYFTVDFNKQPHDAIAVFLYNLYKEKNANVIIDLDKTTLYEDIQGSEEPGQSKIKLVQKRQTDLLNAFEIVYEEVRNSSKKKNSVRPEQNFMDHKNDLLILFGLMDIPTQQVDDSSLFITDTHADETFGKRMGKSVRDFTSYIYDQFTKMGTQIQHKLNSNKITEYTKKINNISITEQKQREYLFSINLTQYNLYIKSKSENRTSEWLSSCITGIEQICANIPQSSHCHSNAMLLFLLKWYQSKEGSSKSVFTNKFSGFTYLYNDLFNEQEREQMIDVFMKVYNNVETKPDRVDMRQSLGLETNYEDHPKLNTKRKCYLLRLFGIKDDSLSCGSVAPRPVSPAPARARARAPAPAPAGEVNLSRIDVEMPSPPKIADELITELENISNKTVKEYIKSLKTDEDVKQAIIVYYTIGLVVNERDKRKELYDKFTAKEIGTILQQIS
jgi:hypothetical protein